MEKKKEGKEGIGHLCIPTGWEIRTIPKTQEETTYPPSLQC